MWAGKRNGRRWRSRKRMMGASASRAVRRLRRCARRPAPRCCRSARAGCRSHGSNARSVAADDLQVHRQGAGGGCTRRAEGSPPSTARSRDPARRQGVGDRRGLSAAEGTGVRGPVDAVGPGQVPAGRRRSGRLPASCAHRPKLGLEALQEEEPKPHRVRRCLERRDPDFERRMRDVPTACRDACLASLEDEGTAPPRPVFTVSVDERPGVQALGNAAPDLPPAPGERPAWSRDHECARHGTVSVLAALDLHAGHVLADVESRRRSREFVALLERLRAHCPQDAVIRIALDSHSARVSRETMACPATRPGRFECVHAPGHGSWPNLIECAFSKMARTLPAPHPRRFGGRTQGPHPPGHRRDERSARAVPMARP